MSDTRILQEEIIEEFSSPVVEEKYLNIAENGLWESEKKLIEKYFTKGSSILDVGCGSGRTTIPLHEAGYQVVGLDITPKMIQIAKKVANSKNLDIKYQIGDATKLQLESNSLDNALFANNGWTQIPGKENRLQALKEIHRILKKGGHFIFTANKRYYTLGYFLFWLKQFIKSFILKPFGFKIKEIDFGDLFYHRRYKGKKLDQKQFIHIGSTREVKKQIKEAGFQLVYYAPMGEISNTDAENMEGTLFPNDNAYKSPIFYVCRK